MNHTTFTTQQVRSALSGDMTCFISKVKPQKKIQDAKVGSTCFTPKDHISIRGVHNDGRYGESFFKLPYKVGRVIPVKETWYYGHFAEDTIVCDNQPCEHWHYLYFADTRDRRPGDVSDAWCYHEFGPNPKCYPRWKSPVTMPPQAARLWLEITGVKCMRIQDACKSNPAFVKKYGSQAWDDNIFIFINEFKTTTP